MNSTSNLSVAATQDLAELLEKCKKDNRVLGEVFRKEIPNRELPRAYNDRISAYLKAKGHQFEDASLFALIETLCKRKPKTKQPKRLTGQKRKNSSCSKANNSSNGAARPPPPTSESKEITTLNSQSPQLLSPTGLPRSKRARKKRVNQSEDEELEIEQRDLTSEANRKEAIATTTKHPTSPLQQVPTGFHSCIVGGIDLPVLHSDALYPPVPSRIVLDISVPAPQEIKEIDQQQLTFSDFNPCLLCGKHITIQDPLVLQCAQCEGSYHTGCFATPIITPSNAQWLCSATCARHYYKQAADLQSPLTCSKNFKTQLFYSSKETQALIIAPPGPLTNVPPAAASDLKIPSPRPSFLTRKATLMSHSPKSLKAFLKQHQVEFPRSINKDDLIKLITLKVDLYTAEEMYDVKTLATPKRGRPRKTPTAPSAPQIVSHLMVAPQVNEVLQKAVMLGMKSLNSEQSELVLNQLLFHNGALNPSVITQSRISGPALTGPSQSRLPSLLPSGPATGALTIVDKGSSGNDVTSQLKTQLIAATKLGIYPLYIYHADQSVNRLFFNACQRVYGNQEGLQNFCLQFRKKLPDWFKNCRNATSSLLNQYEEEIAKHPGGLTPDLLRYPSPLWKPFHLLFPLSKKAQDSELKVYLEWVNITLAYRRDHPHASGESLFEELAASVQQARWQPHSRYQLKIEH